jgi:hypothetical protein
MGDMGMQKKLAEGYVRVHVLDGDGEPFGGPLRGFANGAGWTREGTAKGGEALVLRGIPLGHSFSVFVSGGVDWEGVKQDCEGLLDDGEERVVTVTMDVRAPVFIGRVRGAHGKPLGKLALQVEMHREQRCSFMMSGEVDVDHLFRFIPKGPIGDRITVWARVEGSWIDQMKAALIPPADSHGVHDFGDVKLVVAPVEVAGHVCYPDGTLAAGVYLEWAYEWRRTREESAQFTEKRESLQLLASCAVGRLKALGLKPSGRSTTAEDGSFRALGLGANQKAHFGTQRPHVCKAGTFLLPRDTSGYFTEEESKLTLIQAASLQGTVALDSKQRVDVFVDYPDGYRFLVCTVQGPNPEFAYEALYPGQVILTAVDTETGAVWGSTSSLSLVSGVQTMARIYSSVSE